MLKDLYTVEVADPPPGWDYSMIDIRHRDIPMDQIGNACAALLQLLNKQLSRAGQPGTAVPPVLVRKC